MADPVVSYESVTECCAAIHWRGLAKFAWGKLMTGKYYGHLIADENDLQCAIEAIGDEYIKTTRIKSREGWYDPEEKEFTEEVILGPKVFKCPSCYALWRITPVLAWDGQYWDYEGKCGTCGGTWVERYHARRKPGNGNLG